MTKICVWNILSSGIGSRFGLIPKQEYIFKGKTILQHTIDNIININNEIEIDVVFKIFIVSNSRKLNHTYINGGETRIDSIYNAINYHNKNKTNYDFMIFHDAVRPNIDCNLITNLLNFNPDDNLMVIPVSELVNSVINVNEKFPVKRENLVNTHTPEVFTKKSINILSNCYTNNEYSTSIFNIGLMNNIPFKLVPNSEINFKITYQSDIKKLNDIYDKTLNYSEQKFTKLIDNNFLYTKKNILILGGTSGIGYNLFLELNKLDIHNIHTYGSNNPIESDTFFNKLPNLKWDIIIHSVGSINGKIKKIVDITMESYLESYKIHYESVLRLIHYLNDNQPNYDSKLIIIGSSSSILGTKNMSNYSPLKSALSRLGEVIDQEHKNIKCNIIHPGRTDTKLRKNIALNEHSDILINPSILSKILINIIKTNLRGKNIFISKFNEKEFLKYHSI